MTEALGFQIDSPATSPVTIVLAHGAGASMDRRFIAGFAVGLAALGETSLRP
jgi:predicted alpha/beta-hydrolase family hydrolase